tara:strand:- start:9275 stop:9664 length:390 start_codon:yes stop_codon:yes gene_type:complete
MIRYVFFIACLIGLPVSGFAETPSAPACRANGGSPFCFYEGKVSRLYINSSNLILMYFESPVDVSIPAQYGWNLNSGAATGLVMSDSNNDFAKTFYSTALAAKLADKKISIQMRNTTSGYLKVDRIWLN